VNREGKNSMDIDLILVPKIVLCEGYTRAKYSSD
jgi:hypothetical protein